MCLCPSVLIVAGSLSECKALCWPYCIVLYSSLLYSVLYCNRSFSFLHRFFSLLSYIEFMPVANHFIIISHREHQSYRTLSILFYCFESHHLRAHNCPHHYSMYSLEYTRALYTQNSGSHRIASHRIEKCLPIIPPLVLYTVLRAQVTICERFSCCIPVYAVSLLMLTPIVL